MIYILIVLALYQAFLRTLEHYGYRLPDALRFLTKRLPNIMKSLTKYRRGFVWKTYITFAILFSLFTIFYLYSIAIIELTLATGVVIILASWSLLGLWTPWIENLPNRNLFHKVTGIAHICFGVLMLVFFWIIKWPEWYAPTVVTSFAVLILVFYFVFEILTKRKRKPVARVD